MNPSLARRKKWDAVFSTTGFLATLVGLAALLALVVHLAKDGTGRLSWVFVSSFPSRFPGKAGILSAWVGSAVVMLVTALSAVPLGIASGVYLEEYAPKNRWTDLIEINIANLAGVPSIVYGLMALGLFVYRFNLGLSVLTAGLTLGLLILPVVVMSTREAIRTIPMSLKEAAYAAGAAHWQVIFHHVLPYSMGGIMTGVVLGLSRAIGESAPLITIGALTFISFLPPAPFTGSFPFVSFEWLSSPYSVLPIQMFNWVSRPQVGFHVNAAAAGLVLIFMTLLMNGTAMWIRFHFRRKIKW